MRVKDELYRLIDELDEIDAAAVLAHLKTMLSDEETLSEEAMSMVERGEREVAAGDYVTLDEIRRAVPV